MYGKDPRDVDPVVWDEIVDVADEEEASNKLPAAADVAAPAPDKTKVELRRRPTLPNWPPAATVPMPEFDPDTLYDSDAEDAAEQDMSQVWSLTIKSITGQHVIERRDGLPPCMQRLIFSGKQLQNFAWLKKDEGLVDGSVMHLVVRLRGC
ncbi:hypothetical protein BCR44DRAFT_1425762 [Catenaria anguillulae PL171]|uniref:Ubiquitin-like domain-containing protein n=1 Tax=Catenaria anguillulae PL171 TaxID=765915 RepID=A0A1Y2HZ35_9FUNG|nr:hypothetical protein BCR44DRAFT_1425762 [Catenaria anguillulae PL171]